MTRGLYPVEYVTPSVYMQLPAPTLDIHLSHLVCICQVYCVYINPLIMYNLLRKVWLIRVFITIRLYNIELLCILKEKNDRAKL